jgi:outer membrane protein assembly factor BamB
MRYANRSIYVIVGCLILAAGTSAPAQDWPQWRGPNRDARIVGFAEPQIWPYELTQQWQVIVGIGDAGPALVDGVLYVHTRQGNEEIIMALEADTGKEIWRQKNPAPNIGGPARSHPGPRSTPAVGQGKVVTLGAGGILTCLETDGTVVWRKDPFPGIVPRFFVGMSPMIVPDAVIAHLGGAGNGAIIAYDLNTGDEIWRWAEDGPEYGSPVLLTASGTVQIVTLTDKGLVGVNLADGTLLWRLPFPPRRMAMNCTTPIVYGQTVVYTGQNRGTTAVRIERQGDTFVARQLWNHEGLATGFNTPVFVENLLFGISERGKLFCLDTRTGLTSWMSEFRLDRFGTVLSAGSVLMVISPRSPLIVFEPNSVDFREIARYRVAQTSVYAQPVVSDGAIYVKDQESLIKWSIE